MTHVSITKLTKVYPGSQARSVDSLDLEMESGKITAMLGPSVCGKTTTLKMVAGLLNPSAGDIRFDSTSVVKVAAEKRGAVMVFQNYLLFPYMSIADNVGFGLRMRGENQGTIKKRVSEILGLVQLEGMENRRPKQLSGGQQQRVALARALIVNPRGLLLDEPLSNLDAHLRDEMRELILTIQKETKVTTIFVTHDQEEAVLLADNIALMFDGLLHQQGGPADFYERPVSERAARFFGGVNFVPATKIGNSVQTAIGRFALQGAAVAVPDGPATLTIRPESLKIEPADTLNAVKAYVRSIIYVGTYTRYKVLAGSQELEVIGPSESVHVHKEGDTVLLQLLPDRLWLVPAPDRANSEPRPVSQTFPDAPAEALEAVDMTQGAATNVS